MKEIFNIFNLSWQESAALHINDTDKDEFFSNVINKVFNLFICFCIGILACLPFVFELLIKEGDRVKHGTPVLKINRQFMKERNIDLTTPIVVTNSEYKVFKSNITDVTTDSVIMECTKN